MKKYLIISLAISFISFLLILGILQNYRFYKALSEMNFDKAESISKSALILPTIINVASLGQIGEVKLWLLALREIDKIHELQIDTQLYFEASLNQEQIDRDVPKKIISNLEKLNTELNKIDLKRLNEFKPLLNELLISARKFFTDDQKYLVILQNSDEIRASGGFLGSYFILQTNEGQLNQIKIQDIYEPDGQFKGLVNAPAGLDEYLSSGKGMRLPDANWWPHFPDSAEQILYFLENIEDNNAQQKYQGVIALNLRVIEELLDLTGAIYLPDYKTSVDKNNFAQVARADRSEFFPGSQGKADFLNHFLKMFKFKLKESITAHPEKIIHIANKIISNKDLQIYSRDQEIAKILQSRKVDGQMSNPAGKLYYYLVESNVGINKANRLVEREVTLNLDDEQEKITIFFQNNNPFPYINYQRIYTNKQTELIEIKIDGQRISKIDQRRMSPTHGNSNEKWQEIGFLVPVLAKNHSQVEITLQSNLQKADKKIIFLQKQAGLTETNYKINYLGQSLEFALTADQKIDLN